MAAVKASRDVIIFSFSLFECSNASTILERTFKMWSSCFESLIGLKHNPDSTHCNKVNPPHDCRDFNLPVACGRRLTPPTS